MSACACFRWRWPRRRKTIPGPGSFTWPWVLCRLLAGCGTAASFAHASKPCPLQPDDHLAEQRTGVHVVEGCRRLAELEHLVDRRLEGMFVEEGDQRFEVRAR